MFLSRVIWPFLNLFDFCKSIVTCRDKAHCKARLTEQKWEFKVVLSAIYTCLINKWIIAMPIDMKHIFHLLQSPISNCLLFFVIYMHYFCSIANVTDGEKYFFFGKKDQLPVVFWTPNILSSTLQILILQLTEIREQTK